MSATTYSSAASSSAASSSAASSMWNITFGEVYCDIVDRGRCVTDGPGDYGARERCEVEALVPLRLTAEQYDIEERFDYVTVEGEPGNSYKYKGPKAKFMSAGEKWVWTSDGSVSRQGYKLCGDAGAVLLVCMYVCVYSGTYTYAYLHSC